MEVKVSPFDSNAYLIRWDEWVQQDRLRSFDKELLLQQASCRAVENEPVEANEMEGKSLKNSSKAAGKKTTSAAGDEPEPASLIRKKRKRRSTMCSEEDSLCNKQPEPESKFLLKVNLTNNLWELLQEDFVEISHNKKIFDLPLEPSVSQILQQYLQQNKEEGTDIGEFVDGLEQCFNKALGLLLLYRFERQQYSDVFHDHHSTQTDVATLPNTCWKPSQHYGLIHLLRLLTKIATLFPEEKYPPEKIHHFSKRFDDLVVFLDRNWVALFSRRQYVSAPPQYRSLSKLV